MAGRPARLGSANRMLFALSAWLSRHMHQVASAWRLIKKLLQIAAKLLYRLEYPVRG